MKEKKSFATIIVVNHNGRPFIKECLDSLLGTSYAKSKFEILVVDNCSGDDSVEFIKCNYKQKNLKVIENDTNNYCRANNLAIRKAQGEFIALVNNDVRVSPAWLRELIKVMEKDKRIGVATAKLLNEDGTIQNSGLYELPNFYWEEIGAGKESEKYSAVCEVDAVSGACVLYRWEALKETGLFDEDFLMFGEDVDMSLRLKQKGWKLVFVPNSIGFHKVHGSCNEEFARDLIERNRYLIIAKHFPEKLSSALFGSGYFVLGPKNKESGRIFELLEKLTVKLIREHGPEKAQVIAKELFLESKRILNFENKKLEADLKEMFKDLVETKKDREHLRIHLEDLHKQLDCTQDELQGHKKELANLATKLRESLDLGLTKDAQIIALKEDLRLHGEEITNLSNRLRESLDLGLTKDAQIIQFEKDLSYTRQELQGHRRTLSQTQQALSDYKQEAAILAEKLQESLEQRLRIEEELNNIYSSEGYKVILKPLWVFLFYSKPLVKFVRQGLSDIIWFGITLAMSPFVFIQSSIMLAERLVERLFGKLHIIPKAEREVVPFKDLTLSVVIPNYNGIDLLRKCLSSLYASDDFKGDQHEILVIDDASDNDIASVIKDGFPLVRVIRNQTNQGFGRSCNRGIKEAKGELIVLLNNDIMVSPGFLEPLRSHLKDREVFAVAPKLYYWDKKTFNYGMHMGRFQNGYINLWNEAQTSNEDRITQTSPTIFAVGGALIFRKKDFLWLGGFDDIYRPNCWEDIDLSYQAQKRGLKVLYEPKSVVYHKSAATLNYVRHKEIKNELLFMWKNLDNSSMLLGHLRNLPKLFFRGKHSSRLSFLRGYLWAFKYLLAALINRFKEAPYKKLEDKRVLDRPMLYYRNFMRNNFSHCRKKSILLITPFMLYPLDCGGKLRIYNIYKRLSKKYNLILLALLHKEEEGLYASYLKDVFPHIYTLHPKTTSNEFFFPEHYRFSFSKFLIERLQEIQHKFPLDLVQIESNELLYLTKYIRHVPIVYTEHDISILSYFNSYYKKGLYSSLAGILDYLKLVYYHSIVYQRLEHVITLSKEDSQAVKAFSPSTSHSLIPTGVDLRHFTFREKTGLNKTLIFVGHYPHYPNEEAVVYFCRQIFPLIKKKIPELRIKLVGSSPTEEVINLSKIPGVEVVGRVGDVNPYLQEASVFVTAFRRSAGIKGKVLEAMATGTPVVSTTKGACGIDAQDKKEILLADNPVKFAQSVISLLTDASLYKRIALNARKLVEENYDWDKIVFKLDAVYQDVIYDKDSGQILVDSDLRKQEQINTHDSPGQESAVIVPESQDKAAIDLSLSQKCQSLPQEKFLQEEKTSVALMPKKEEDRDLAAKIKDRVDKIVNLSLERLSSDPKEIQKPHPEELHIELTYSCNSRCITCDIWDFHSRNHKSNKDELTLAEISNLLQNSQRLKEIKTVVLSGGEPFLRQDIVDICAQIKKSLPHVSIGILTNALDSENILLKSKLIAEIFSPSSFWLGTSLDGLAGIYDRIRGIEGGFVRFLKTVRDLKSELPAVRLSATFVLTSFNIDQLIPCWDFSQEHNLDFFAQFGVLKPARSEDVFKWSKEQFREIEKYTAQIIEKLITRQMDREAFYNSLSVVSDKINLLTKIYYWQHLVDFQDRNFRFTHHCDAAFRCAMLDPYGNLFFCPIIKEKVVGNIREKTLDNLWNSKEADQIRDFIAQGNCSCWLVCTVFPIVDKALILYGDKIAEDLLGNEKPIVAIKTLAEPRLSVRGEIREGANLTLNNSEFREKKVVLESLPEGLTIGANYKCNAQCMFCLEGDYRSFNLKFYREYFEKRIGFMLQEAEHVSFCGMGELLLAADIEEFLDYLNQTLPSQNKILTTNGFALGENILRRVIESKYSIQISLHASSAPLHAQLTGIKSGFDKIITNIQQLARKRKNKESPYIVLVFLINTLNIEDLPNFVELASSLGVDCVQCNYLTIFKEAHLKLSCFFKQKVCNEMLDKAKEIAEKSKITLIIPPKFSQDFNAYFRTICSEPWKNIYIDTEGAVLPCCYAGEHFGELQNTDILSIWNNQKYQELRKGLALNNTISMCKYCLNNNPANVNELGAHISFRPEVQKKILAKQ